MILFAFILAACDPENGAPEPPETQEQPGGEETAEPTSAQAPEPSDPVGEGPERGGRTSPDGMCGGIAGFRCPEGQWCDMAADHPDASGTCREDGWCEAPADCEAQDIPHIMCVGEWRCEGNRCAFECG